MYLHIFKIETWLGNNSFSSVLFSHSVISDSLGHHEPQHTRPPCPLPIPGVHLNPCPLIRWCHPTISSSVVPFSFCPQSFPASRSFPMSQLFASGSQSVGVSASTSVLQMNAQDWTPLGWTGWIFLQSKGLSRVFSNTTVQKHQFFGAQRRKWQPTPVFLPGQSHGWRSLVGYSPWGPKESNPTERLYVTFFTVQLSHPYMTTGKTIALTRRTFVDKVMSLLFNMLSRLVITFLPRSGGWWWFSH